jgi:hypothetical protein
MHQSVQEIPHPTIYCAGLGACGTGMHSAWKKIQASRNCSCYGVVCYGKYLGLMWSLFLDWTLVFEWYASRFVVKTRHQKYINYIEIGLYVRMCSKNGHRSRFSC